MIAVVALHVLVEIDVAALTEGKLLTVFQFYLLKNGGENLLDLLLIYSFKLHVIARCTLDRHRRLNQAKIT